MRNKQVDFSLNDRREQAERTLSFTARPSPTLKSTQICLSFPPPRDNSSKHKTNDNSEMDTIVIDVQQ